VNSQRRKAVLYLSGDQEKDKKAKDLLGKISHRFEVFESDIMLAPTYQKRGVPVQLPALVPETRRARGGGGAYGLDGIDVFVELELEKEQDEMREIA
jgi:hypothetical protein